MSAEPLDRPDAAPGALLLLAVLAAARRYASLSRLSHSVREVVAATPKPGHRSARTIARSIRRMMGKAAARIGRCTIAALFLAPTWTSCTSVRTRTHEGGNVTMTQEQFAAYVEHVFRYHNKVMNDLIDATGEGAEFGDSDDGLADAEERMNEACEPLNEVVSAEAVSQSASFWTKSKLPEAVPDCEDATHHLEFLLREAFKTRKTLDLKDLPAGEPD